MQQPNRNYTSSSYRYGFNGMEKDDELKGEGNSIDFGARIYDSRLGRWLIIDPFAYKYPYASPYNYTMNNPIKFTDPDGRYVKGGKTTSLSSFLKMLNAWGVEASKDKYRERELILVGVDGQVEMFESENHAKFRIMAHDITANNQIITSIGSYTKSFGSYIDVGLPLDFKHFMGYANKAYNLPDGIVRNASLYREYRQSLDAREGGRTSSFSPEDVFSNYLGTYFGGDLGSGDFEKELSVFLNETKTLFTTGDLKNGKYLTASRITELKSLAKKYYGTEDLTKFQKNSDLYKLSNIKKGNDAAEKRLNSFEKGVIKLDMKINGDAYKDDIKEDSKGSDKNDNRG